MKTRKFTFAERISFEIHSVRRNIERLWCWMTWHIWKRGQNGWENFGTGIYCTKCSKMYNDPFMGNK